MQDVHPGARSHLRAQQTRVADRNSPFRRFLSAYILADEAK